MSRLFRASATLLCLSLVATARIEGAGAGTQQQPAVAANDSPGRAIFQRKCTQCHQAGMWTSLRQDRRAWESTLYRMVGRGALWTPEEISAMADYLAQIRGKAEAGQRGTP